MELDSIAAKARPSVLTRLRRWFSWRRRRFWFITLPVAVFFGMIATLMTLFLFDNVKNRAFKIGPWTVAEIDGWSSNINTGTAATGMRHIVWTGRSVRLGWLELCAERTTGDPAPRLLRPKFVPGLNWHANRDWGGDYIWTFEWWTFSLTVGPHASRLNPSVKRTSVPAPTVIPTTSPRPTTPATRKPLLRPRAQSSP